MKPLEKIKMIVKRIEYYEVEVSAESGYDMPEGLVETIDFIKNVELDFQTHIDAEFLVETKFELEEFNIIEGDE